MNETMKYRGNKNFNDAARNRRRQQQQQGGQRRGGIVDGKFDRLILGERALWVHLPIQAYSYDVYDRDSKEIVRMEDYPYLEFINHFIPIGNTPFARTKSKGRFFNCSSGVAMKQPCYGCKKRKLHYARLEEIKERTGVKPPKEDAPCGKGNRFAMSAVIMEWILQIPKFKTVGGKQEVMKTKRGVTIYDYEPVPVSSLDPEDQALYSRKYGHRCHWSFSPTHLDQLMNNILPKVVNHCGNCATEMLATGFICTACENHVELEEALTRDDLLEAQKAPRLCRACGQRSAEDWIAVLACPGCGDPVEGQVLGLFDLKLREIPVGGDSKGTMLELVDVRMHQAPASANLSPEDLSKLCDTTLDLVRIFAPDSLEDQRKLFKPELIDGVDPTMDDGSVPYGGNSEDHEDMALPDSLRG